MACLRSSEAVVEEKDLIAGLWAKLGGLLAAGFDTVVHEIRCMEQDSPDVHSLAPKDMLHLAQLHLSSSGNLVKTMRLVAPAAFVSGAATPDQTLLLQLEGPALQLVSSLIELQLYHLQRAAVLVAHARQHLHGTSATAAA